MIQSKGWACGHRRRVLAAHKLFMSCEMAMTRWVGFCSCDTTSSLTSSGHLQRPRSCRTTGVREKGGEIKRARSLHTIASSKAQHPLRCRASCHCQDFYPSFSEHWFKPASRATTTTVSLEGYRWSKFACQEKMRLIAWFMKSYLLSFSFVLSVLARPCDGSVGV